MKFKLFVCWTMLMFSTVAASLEADLNQYRLGAGDVIKITVFGQEDLTLTTRLPHLGSIKYPFLGDITVVGLTASALESKIYDGLKPDYLVNPSVSVAIQEYRPFFIDGEVKRAGGYPYQPGLSIDKAAALAGGYTERASKTKIIIRREVDGSIQSFDAAANDTVLPGDIITVQQSFF